jgi:hypothetical protein
MNNCNFTADILVTVTTLVQTIANCVFFNPLYYRGLRYSISNKGNPYLGHSLTTFQNTEMCLYEWKICH